MWSRTGGRSIQSFNLSCFLHQNHPQGAKHPVILSCFLYLKFSKFPNILLKIMLLSFSTLLISSLYHFMTYLIFFLFTFKHLHNVTFIVSYLSMPFCSFYTHIPSLNTKVTYYIHWLPSLSLVAPCHLNSISWHLSDFFLLKIHLFICMHKQVPLNFFSLHFPSLVSLDY